MAVTRRGYIFATFFLSVASVILIVIGVSTDSWVTSLATRANDEEASQVKYGLFRGVLTLNILAEAEYSLYMTCVPDVDACAVSCKTEPEAREIEVRALANRFQPNEACVSVTTVNENVLLDEPAVISFKLYIATLILLFLWLILAVVAAGLAIINATTNPTEPVFGLPGCLWSNAITALLGLTVLLLFGIYWAVSSLQHHLALTHIAIKLFEPVPGLGYSYLILIASVICSLCNIALLQMRSYLLERDPPPPTIKVENHSDGTIFLY